MAIFPPKVSQVIGEIVDLADQYTREQMSLGIVSTENEYTAVFASTFRMHMRHMPPPFFATARVQSPKAERLTGTDACIILDNGTEAKILLYEAKLFTNNGWDRLEKSTGCSHFDSQLYRQQNKIPSYALVYELFYTRRPLGKSLWKMHSQGATCIPHDATTAYRGTPLPRPPAWRPKDARGLFSSHPPVLSLGQVVEEMSNCHAGKPVTLRELTSFLDKAGRLAVLRVAGPKEFEFNENVLSTLREQIPSLAIADRPREAQSSPENVDPQARGPQAKADRKKRRDRSS